MPLILNGSTGISGNDGSASVPTIQGTDTNTGMFFPAADQIAFAEGGVEAMRLDASGNVGIGTSLPGYRLEVRGTAGTIGAVVTAANAGGNAQININSGFNSTVPVYGFWFNGDTGLGNPANQTASIITAGVERVRVTPAGQLLVNATGVVGGDQAPLQSNGGAATALALRGGSNNFFVAFWNSAGSSLIGSITGSTGSSTFYNTTSDYRLKANVVPLTDASARVQALKPSRFNFIADPDRTVDGFIAHEAAEVVPEAVHGEKDAVDAEGRIQPQGIDHSKLVPLLTAALQEALTEIAALKARVAALEAR